jgi:RND superfamily putative drug exporter
MVAAWARLLRRLRWPVVAGWAAVTLAVLVLPAPAGGGGGAIEGIIPLDLPPVATEIRSAERFGFPLLARTVVVQRDPNGLSGYTQSEAVLRAAALTRGEYDDAAPLLGAIPVPNTFRLFPGSRESGTTVLTLLFVSPRVAFAEQYEAARRFVDRHYEPEDSVVGVTGSVPARAEQARLLDASLPLVETVTLVVIVLIVAATFRSLVAPVLTLAAAGVGVVVALRTVEVLSALLGVSAPDELRPLLVALTLGLVTDYAVFFLSAFQRRLVGGAVPTEAAVAATREVTPIVVVAGVVVAAGTGALAVAESTLLRALGPAMAVAALVGMAVAVTLVPALLLVLGRAALWPGARSAGAGAPSVPAVASARRGLLDRVARRLADRRVAVAVVGGCVAVLGACAVPLRHLDLGMSFVGALPPGNQVQVAADAARAGFAPGIVSPTVLLVERPGITSQRAELQRLGDLLAAQRGVAGVLGPGQQLAPVELGIVLSRDGGAARFMLVLDHPPTEAVAVDTLTRLQERMGRLLAAAGLPGAEWGMAGDTAIAASLIERTRADLGRVGTAVVAVNFLVLAVFLRALVAPLLLLGSSLLALAATLGLTTLVFQDLGGNAGLTFYVPFAAAVLLVALGSDYTVFVVGQVWEQARHRPLVQAIALAVPRSSRAITVAGLTLAASFALLALVPLLPFRELAFALAVGVLLDALVVRSLLVPALLALAGPAIRWPGRHLRRSAARR